MDIYPFIFSVILTLVLGSALFFSLIPKTAEIYCRFNTSKSSADFSYFVFLVAFSLALLLTIYTSFARILIVFPFAIPNIVVWLLGFFCFILIFSFLIPRSYVCFKKWKETGRSIYFSAMSLYAFLSFLLFSFFLMKTILAILGIKNGL
jgi:hypothetical protein